MPWVRRWRARDAGDRAEIFIDGSQVMVRYVLKTRPGHYLEKISPERSRNAARVNHSCRTSRMQVIQVHARPYDLNKLRKLRPLRAGRFYRVSGCGEMMCAEGEPGTTGQKSLPPPKYVAFGWPK